MWSSGSFRVPALCGLALMLAVAGCEERRFTAALGRDSADAYHGFLARYPAGPRAREVRARLEALQWREARAIDSVYGYRRYLADHPDGRFTREARRRLGEQRLARARAAGDAAAVRRLIDTLGDPALVAQARALLVKAELRAALARGDAAALGAFLDEFPDGEGAAEAQARLRSVDLRDAGDDLGALERILARYPGTVEAAAAATRIEQLEAERVRAAGDDAAAALARFRARFPQSARGAALEDEVARAQLACIDAHLDGAALAAWVAQHEAHPAAGPARARATSLRARTALAARVRPLLAAALPYRPTATLDELRARALGAELETARVAVAEIATVASPEAAALLVDLATGPQLIIAAQAVDALEDLCRPAGAATCRELLAGAHTARPGEPPALRLALLRLARGDEAGAFQSLVGVSVAGERGGRGRVLPAVLMARLAARHASAETARVALVEALGAVEAHLGALERLFPVDLDRDHLPDAVLAARTAAALNRLLTPLAATSERAAGLRARIESRLALWEPRVRAVALDFAPAAADPLGGRVQARQRGRAAALAALAELARRAPLARPALELARAPRPLVTRCPAGPAATRGP